MFSAQSELLDTWVSLSLRKSCQSTVLIISCWLALLSSKLQVYKTIIKNALLGCILHNNWLRKEKYEPSIKIFPHDKLTLVRSETWNTIIPRNTHVNRHFWVAPHLRIFLSYMIGTIHNCDETSLLSGRQDYLFPQWSHTCPLDSKTKWLWGRLGCSMG